MYISELELQNIRCFDRLILRFDQPGSAISLFGDNGEGKSTVLRSIAMGLCDQSSAAALFRELPGDYVRRSGDQRTSESGTEGSVRIDLVAESGESFRIVTHFISLEVFERVSQTLFALGPNGEERTVQDSDFPWDEVFVAGYGAGIRTQGTSDFEFYQPVEAVYPLFRYDTPLQNPELGVLRLLRAANRNGNGEADVLARVKHLLADILGLQGDDHIDVSHAGIRVIGPWGNAALGELGDGYQSMVTMILDLLSWWFLKTSTDKEVALAETESIKGIVLIDEVEQHLHPLWQRTILKSLRACFPKVQFIVATHSPLCAIGTTDMDDDQWNIYVLRSSGGAVEGHFEELPRGKRADQVLTSALFGLRTTGDNETKGQVARYAQLAKKERSIAEDNELAELSHLLGQKLGSGETPLETVVADAVYATIGNATAVKDIPDEAVRFEVVRQVKELLFGQDKK